jgi:hypothetical protein
MDMWKTFEQARRVSAPFIIIRTSDQFEVAQRICDISEPNGIPVLQWDAVQGITAIRRSDGGASLGKDVMTTAKGSDNKPAPIISDKTINFTSAMLAAERLPQSTCLIVHNAHRQLSGDMVPAANVQAVQNLRDQYKRNWRALVLLVGLGYTVPMELKHDVILLDHQLPGEDDLRQMVKEIVASAKTPDGASLSPLSEADMTRAVAPLSGLSPFAAEQVASMSLTENGVDFDAMWARARTTIEGTPGLSVFTGTTKFSDLLALDAVKDRARSRITAKRPIGVVVWIDEGSDVFQNVEGDQSGVKMDQQRALLINMQKRGWKGMIFVGVSGSGKSALAGSIGNEAGVPTIEMDLGGMERKHVGESEENVRMAIETIAAVGRGNALVILTCNSLRGIRPQFMRRFKKGVFFFDLLTAEERDMVWRFYLNKYGLDVNQPRPDDDGWTGSEIEECVEDAWDTNRTIMEASKFIIPVAISRPDEIEQMRQEATGRFLDASKFGKYQYDPKRIERQARRGVQVGAVQAFSQEIGKA